MRILLADNDIEHRTKLAKFFEGLGHVVEEVLNGSEVKKKCRTKCPDLILLDDNLAGEESIEIVKQVRQLGGTAVWNPIVLMGEKTDESDLVAAIEAGADDYFLKPIDQLKFRYRLASAQRIQDLQEDVFSVAHELVLATHALESGATKDVMTGVLDIQTFHKSLEKEWFDAKKTMKPLSMLILNIDNFREYNDTYGSDKGDECIKKIASTLKSSLPKGYNIFARTIGDTFALLMPNTTREKAFEIAKDLHKVVDDLKIAHSSSHISDHITTSVGVGSTENENQKNPLELMEASDYALYKAKHEGRNKVFVENIANKMKSVS